MDVHFLTVVRDLMTRGARLKIGKQKCFSEQNTFQNGQGARIGQGPITPLSRAAVRASQRRLRGLFPAAQSRGWGRRA